MNFHFRGCRSSNAPVGVFLCDAWYSSIQGSVAVNITGSPGYGIELKNGGTGNWITDSVARGCRHVGAFAFCSFLWAGLLSLSRSHLARFAIYCVS